MTPPGIALGVKFQSTLPRRERPVVRNEIDKYKTFQSTLPRRERPAIIFGDTTAWNVSIHAPTKGATCCQK